MRSERDYQWGQNQKVEDIDKSKIPEVITQGKYQVILVAGPNGVGKGTIIKGLLERNSDLVQVSRATTKSVAADENQYHQIPLESFIEAVDRGDFLEWGKYGQGYYGTGMKDVVEALGRGNRLIIDVDLDGGLVLREFFEDFGIRVCDCFISPINQNELETEGGLERGLAELQKRLSDRNRGEGGIELEGRLKNARQMLLKANEFRYTISNEWGNVDSSVMAIENLTEKI